MTTESTNSNIPAEWIDQIPTRPSALKSRVVSVAAAMLAGLGCGMWKVGPPALQAFLDRNGDAAIALGENHLADLLFYCFPLFGIVGAIVGVCGVLSLVRTTATYRLLRLALVSVYPAVAAYVVVIWLSLRAIVSADATIDGATQERVTSFVLLWQLCWPALAIAVYVAWLSAMLRSRSVYAAFTRRDGPAMDGDRVLEDWRTHGRDPRARRSAYSSILTHIFVIIIIPMLLQTGGCVEAYRVPKGSGNPVVALVKMTKPKKKKKKKLALRSNSAILFDIPDLDDTEVDRKMEEQTQATHVAGEITKPGNLGSGGGPEGGWPAGMENYKIRFIRLDHGGAGWDDGMNQTEADINFLRGFAKITGFKKIASGGESHPISLLAKYPKDAFPPFVFLTGNGGMGTVSASDKKILRDYCLNGGMLIADAGSASFDRSFRQFIGQVFTDKTLIDIADDDILYQLPFGFTDGAPEFWHHGGSRAMGIKHEGRWIAFYHPGDMNDCWKSAGYSDPSPEWRDDAMHLGVNLINYAFTQWNDAVSKLQK